MHKTLYSTSRGQVSPCQCLQAPMLPTVPYFQQILRPSTLNVFSSIIIVLAFWVLIKCDRVLADAESQKSWRQSQSEISSVNFHNEQQTAAEGLSHLLSLSPHQCLWRGWSRRGGVTRGGAGDGPSRVTSSRGWHPNEKKMFCGWI